jgi:predicted patatin/cPLA2 family phospholipase
MRSTFAENIRIRDTEIKAGKKSDIVTGLVVQGGGMRGIYSMAALYPFEELGMRHAFDHIVAASAGAINGIYLISGQAKDGVTSYSHEISNHKFVNFFRFWKIVNIDFLVDDVVKGPRELKYKEAQNAFTTVHAILTDYETSEAKIVTNKDKNIDLAEVIRATSAMPILYNRVVNVNGRGYIDGGLREAVPLLRAIEMGCTDILVVLTRPPDFRRKAPGSFMRIVESIFLKDFPEATRKLILSADPEFNKTMNILSEPKKHYPDINISVIYPSNQEIMVGRTTSNQKKLLNCAYMARNDTRRLLGECEKHDKVFDIR